MAEIYKAKSCAPLIVGKDGKAANHDAEKAKEPSKYFCSDLEGTNMIYVTAIRTTFYSINKLGGR